MPEHGGEDEEDFVLVIEEGDDGSAEDSGPVSEDVYRSLTGQVPAVPYGDDDADDGADASPLTDLAASFSTGSLSDLSIASLSVQGDTPEVELTTNKLRLYFLLNLQKLLPFVKKEMTIESHAMTFNEFMGGFGACKGDDNDTRDRIREQVVKILEGPKGEPGLFDELWELNEAGDSSQT